ncbi:hypothetical protein [Paenibacillus sp. 2TAB19]|uniref:hypothetical protein n=1 Tax=Paenibacillus sp. 2TAB19 TaxID=3233003 RepID=UPI003F9D74C5
MFWTLMWFIVNILFVTSVIVFLFMHRAYKEAALQADRERLAKSKGRRLLFGVISVALLIAMVVSFLINMRMNG